MELFRRHGNHKPKRFDFGIEYKSVDRFGNIWSSERNWHWTNCCVFKVLEYIIAASHCHREEAIWAASWQNQQNGMCVQRRLRSVWASAQSYQSSLSARRKLGSLANHWAHSEDSDQTGRMPRLIWIFAGRTVILLVLSWGGSFDSKLQSLVIQKKQQLNEWMCGLFGVPIRQKPKSRVVQNEPRHEKTCLRGFRPGKTQTGLLSYRDKLESLNFGFSKYRYYTI